jgi:hypothetical protein
MENLGAICVYLLEQLKPLQRAWTFVTYYMYIYVAFRYYHNTHSSCMIANNTYHNPCTHFRNIVDDQI